MIGQPRDLAGVVADVERRDRQAPVQALQIGQDLGLGAGVQAGERLVHQEQPGLGQERPAQRHPLPLAAREVGHRAAEQGREAQQIHRVVEPDLHRGRGALGAVHQVPAHRQVAEQARLLEHHAHRPPMGRHEGPRVLPDFAANREPARQPRQAGDAAQQGGLARARRTAQRRDAAGRQLELGVQPEAAQRSAEPALHDHRTASSVLRSTSSRASSARNEKTTTPAASRWASPYCRLSTNW